jgi:uncharacterized phage protein (TIGR02220 family)
MTLKEKHAELIQLIGEDEAKRLLNNWYSRTIKRISKRKAGSEPENFDEQCRRILKHLTGCTGISYRLGCVTRALIKARMNDGFTEEDFKHVHLVKTKEWLDDDKMRMYLIPETLYRPTKFPRYINQWQMMQKAEADKERKQEQIRRRQLAPEPPEKEETKMTGVDAEEARKIVQASLARITGKRGLQ